MSHIENAPGPAPTADRHRDHPRHGDLLRRLVLDRELLNLRTELTRLAAEIVLDYELQEALSGAQISGLAQAGTGGWKEIREYIKKRAERCAEGEGWRKKHCDKELKKWVELAERIERLFDDQLAPVDDQPPPGELMQKVEELSSAAQEKYEKCFGAGSFGSLSEDEEKRLWHDLKQEILARLVALYRLNEKGERREVERCRRPI